MNMETASEHDLDRILQLQKKAFHGQALIYNDFNLPPLLQTIDDLKKEFKLKTFYKMESDGKIIASVRCFIKDQTLYIEKLIVDPDFQNKGIGAKMMREVEARYSSMVRCYALFTGDKSARNLHLYRKLGYKDIKQEPTTHGYNLIYMEKSNNNVTA
jgi:ribosomal protein S18 acetylase RimI-like enzyme